MCPIDDDSVLPAYDIFWVSISLLYWYQGEENGFRALFFQFLHIVDMTGAAVCIVLLVVAVVFTTTVPSTRSGFFVWYLRRVYLSSYGYNNLSSTSWRERGTSPRVLSLHIVKSPRKASTELPRGKRKQK